MDNFSGGEKIANWWRENCKLVERVDKLSTSMLKCTKKPRKASKIMAIKTEQQNFRKHLVTKRNELNELSPRGMTLQQLRFIVVYLSMIDPFDESTRLVRFSLSDFKLIMEMGRLNIQQLSNSVDDLLSKVTGTVTETGDILRFQYFKRCRIGQNDGEWYIEIDAHDDALPMFFNLKSNYFKYQLWNGLRLKSLNQLRFYEILKQYQWRGYRVVAVSKLKDLLGIGETEYVQYKDFRRSVIDVCQKVLSENTDITFTYEPHGKKGRGGKILELRFNIFENKKNQDPLDMEKFIMETDEKQEETCNLTIETDLTEIEHLSNFEMFWMNYPEHKRSGRKQAMYEWDKLPLDATLFKEIMEGLENAKNSNKWTSDKGAYVNEPSNWLRQERWKDAPNDTATTKIKPKIQNFTGRSWSEDYFKNLEKLEKERINKRIVEINNKGGD